jgi:hypothetical protein
VTSEMWFSIMYRLNKVFLWRISTVKHWCWFL